MITQADIHNARILIVDDRESNVRVLEHMLTSTGYLAVSFTQDSREVCALQRRHHYDLILLDLNMPHMDGFAVMEELKKLDVEDYLSVLVLTAQPEHKLRALQAGAKDFIAKPYDRLEVLTRIRNMLEVRLLHKALRGANDLLEQRVRQRTAELHDSHRETIYTIVRAAEHKDEDTGKHIQRISYFSQELARQLGLDARFCDQIFYASPMHDIGKIAIPDEILLKPGGFTPPEWEVMKTHAAMGAEILGEVHSPYLVMGSEIALNHHERWSGGGYPSGLQGEAIPLSARIMNICDIYDALRSKRPYKPAYDHQRALEIITQGDGRTSPAHFDPAVLACFTQHHATIRDIYETNEG